MPRGQIKHGKSDTPIYRIWSQMIERCTRVTHKRYALYGGRGIYVCDRWKKFENFYADMGDRPAGRSLDRINNDGPYSPENCAWRTPREQAINSRNAHKITLDGETLALCEWADRLGIPAKTLSNRITKYGWAPERALRTPHRAPRKNRVILTHNGETHPIEVWAARCGLTPDALRLRLHKGWTVADVLTTPPSDNKPKCLTFRGQTLSVTEWASAVSLKRTTIKGRLARGWSVEEALTAPTGPQARKAA